MVNVSACRVRASLEGNGDRTGVSEGELEGDG